jgi:hypothetical protein
MKTFKLQISYPSIVKAPEFSQVWLENIFGMTLIEKFIERFNFRHEIVKTTDKGPVLVVYDIKEEDLKINVDKLKELIMTTIERALNNSSLQRHIDKTDVRITLESNFDELVKKLPELEGIF